MTGIEIKHSLRKMEWPLCAKEAVNKIQTLIVGRTPSIKHMDLSMDLMSEFVFCETDRKGNKRTNGLTSIQEIQLLEVLADYFSQNGTEAAKNTVFLSLFGPSYVNVRSKILCKLVSMAISTCSASVLIAAGAWMQQLGCTSPPSLQLGKAIVNDYFALIPNVLSCLKTLPEIAPQFTANFLTVVAENYLGEKSNSFTLPPESLLNTITEWISDNSTLCLAAQHSPAALPSGGIAMAAITPIAGLFKWCILAPLYFATSSKYNTSNEQLKTQCKRQLKCYSRLHLALLESLLESRPGPGLPTTVCAQHLSSVIVPVQGHIGELIRLGKPIRMDSSVQVAVDRLAQAVQVSLASNCMYGNTQELLTQLEQLPENRLLTIVIKIHRQCAV